MKNKPVRALPRIYYGYWIVFALFLCQVIVHGSAIYSFSLFVVPLDNAFSWSRTVIMTGFLISNLVAGFTAPLISGMVSRLGIKRVFITGALCLGSGFVLLGTTQSIWQFYLYYALVGFGYTAAGVVPATMVIANWFVKRRGFAIGIIGMGIGLGGFVMPWIVGGLVLPNFSWQISYGTIGIIAAAVIIPLALFILKPKPVDTIENGGNTVGNSQAKMSGIFQETGISARAALKMPAFWFLGIAIFCMSIGLNNSTQNQIPHLQNIGFSAVAAAAVMQATGIGSAIGKMGFGWLCDHIKPKFVFMMGCALNGIAALMLISISSSTSIAIIWICGFINGLGAGCWLPSISMNTSYTFGLISYGVIFGIYQMVFQVAGALGPVAGGYIYDITRSYVNSFWLCIVVQIIAIIFIFMLKRPKRE